MNKIIITKTIRQHLLKLARMERRKHHPLLHHIHKKHNISKKTLFYVKEYGPHSHVTKVILKESMKVLLLASIISSFGGFAIEQIKLMFVSILPLIILLPALNDMIGDYGTIISSKFSTMLHEGKVDGDWLRNKHMIKLFLQIMITAVITGIISAGLSVVIAHFAKFAVTPMLISKIMLITIIDVITLVSLLFVIAVYAGRYYFRKQEDPNNFLIPITTSVADFGNMVVLAVLIILLF